MRTVGSLLVGLFVVACGNRGDSPPPAPAPKPDAAATTKANGYTTKTIALPGGTAEGVYMDYLLFNPRTSTVWAPAGNSGSVDVVNTATDELARIEGFATQEME